jgi:hypothetical protein
MRLRSYRRRRRGVASVLGILIMVGILMTSILPTFIYVNEVNNYYDRTVVDLKIADDERSKENLEVYAFGYDNTTINVFIINRSPLAVNIMRIWVMEPSLQNYTVFNSTNLPADLPYQMSASEQVTFALNFSDIMNFDGFMIEVTTERGNKFSSVTNPLTYDSDNGWQTGTMEFHIQVLINSGPGNDWFKIEITGLNETHFDYIDSGNNLQGQYFAVFNVPLTGYYNVTASEKQGQGQPWELIDYEEVILTWIYPNAFCQFTDPQG